VILQPAADHREALSEAGADQHSLSVARGAANPAQVVGERLAQRRHAARIGIPDRVERRLAPRGSQRSQPAVARESGQIGQAGMEVVRKARQQRPGRDAGLAAHGPRNADGRALPGQQIALGGELVESLGDDAARDPELPCQRPGRGKLRPGGQAAVTDALADRSLDLLVERQVGVAVDLDKQT
jgi:hypothetical protein